MGILIDYDSAQANWDTGDSADGQNLVQKSPHVARHLIKYAQSRSR